MDARDRPQPGVRFVYLPAVDLDAMQVFYSELLGLAEIYHSADEGALAYDCAGLQFTILESADAVPADEGWATQPGWQGHTVPRVSWSVVLADDGRYRAAVDALRLAGVRRLHDQPVWMEYWSFPVLDPMGNTVEVTFTPDGEPISTSWEDAWP